VATAQPSDVILEEGSAGVIATDLSEAEVQGYIDDAAYEAKSAISGYEGWEDEDKTQLEKYLAALKVRTFADRAIDSTSRETASVTYEGMSTAEIRRAVDQRDPSGTLATQRDTNRYVGSTHETS
jgi:hypothetical protein